MSHKMKLPPRVEEWTKEHVCQWLAEELKIDQTWTDKLYEEEVSGKELICFKPRDLRELGIKLGPAVRIINTLEALIKSHENVSDSDMHTDISQTQSHSEPPGRTEHTETKSDGKPDMLSNDDMSVHVLHPRQKPKKSKKKSLYNPDTCKISASESPNEASSKNALTERTELQIEATICDLIESEPTEMSTVLPSEMEKESKAEAFSKNVPDQVTQKESVGSKDLNTQVTNTKRLCSFYPFDQQSVSHRYIENYSLLPETGPSNLIDPVHEYKFLGRAENITVMKKKINKEVFRFAAGCMNRRTNGTIHFGVADSKETSYSHGEIIGVSVDKTDTIIDHFNLGIKSYFEDNAGDAKRCIRQPRFVEVLSSDSTSSSKYVIEVDIL